MVAFQRQQIGWLCTISYQLDHGADAGRRLRELSDLAVRCAGCFTASRPFGLLPGLVAESLTEEVISSAVLCGPADWTLLDTSCEEAALQRKILPVYPAVVAKSRRCTSSV